MLTFFYESLYNIILNCLLQLIAQSAGAVEYTDCTSAER